jgi:hypothetical protein
LASEVKGCGFNSRRAHQSSLGVWSHGNVVRNADGSRKSPYDVKNQGFKRVFSPKVLCAFLGCVRIERLKWFYSKRPMN